MAGRLIDITPTVSPRIAVWPGDVPYTRTINAAFAQGANLDLSSISTTVHLGAHTDAPSHYHADGVGIDRRPLDRYYGACQVVTVAVARNARILPADLPTAIRAPRVLFRTDTFPDPTVFNEDFAALSPELVDHLADRGVVLVGLDTPSVDPCHDRDLRSHNAIYRRDLAILEGVVLDDAPDGLYTLIALPLKLEGADASPVRAVLVADDEPPATGTP